jgi:hypothetical protein
MAAKKKPDNVETGSEKKVPTAMIGLAMIILTNYQEEIKKIINMLIKVTS